ncbi:flap endonuclease-1 [Candidatus Woesearchaeota archaeon]|nr:flap endonuclease-1 [Candidatus Woesearchaeota archaeon]
MGIAIKDLIISKEISMNDLNNKILAVDSFNMLYQFLTTIRSSDGSLLTDSKGNVTSHLIGLFSRVTTFMELGLKPVFVFDGPPPKLKIYERKRRSELKAEAKKEYEIAKEREDITSMKKYAARTTKLTSEMVDDAKELITCLGLPIIQAASEGEAQAAYIVKQNDAFASVSQDFDSLLYGAPNIIRNLSIAGKRKKNSALGYTAIKPELINLDDNLKSLGISNEQLLILSMLVGTDYNIGGIKGIGPQKALKLVKQYKHAKSPEDYNLLFKEVKWQDYFDYPWQDVYETFRQMPVEKTYSIKFAKPEPNKLMAFLCDKHDFDKERVEKTLAKLMETKDMKQKGLGEFF